MRPRRDQLVLPAIAVVGAGATWAAAVAFGMTLGEAARMVALSGGPAVGAGVVGGIVLLAIRRRSILAQLAVLTLVGIAAVVVGVLAASKAMFLSDHDQRVLTVILIAGGTIAVLVAVWLGRRLVAGNRSLREAIRSIGSTGGSAPGDTGAPLHAGASPTAELTELTAELERMTRRLAEGRERERAIEDSRRELIAWVSHDLRTPLAGLRATAEALADGVLSEPAEVDAAYRTLRRETERLADLVDDLFELAVIQAGALTLHLEPASIGDLVSDALSGASMRARAQGVHLEGRLVGPVPDLLLSPSGLARVLRNLLENAIRHTPHDGTVLVEAGVDGDRAFVSVLDGCGGIPEADLGRVFDPAFRGERARTPRDHGGAGLGLAIARGIVEAHAGALGVRNDGPGCRFVVQLPLRSADEGPSARRFVTT